MGVDTQKGKQFFNYNDGSENIKTYLGVDERSLGE